MRFNNKKKCKSIYGIVEDDLIEDLKGFPIYIVNKMIEYQTDQGNDPDVDVFRYSASESCENGGFDWDGTKEGFDFWEEIIEYRNFDHFLTIYKDEI